MMPEESQLELFGPQKTDFGSAGTSEHIPDLPVKDHDCRDPTIINLSDQGNKAHLTEIQKERARSLHQKSKDLVSKAYKNSNPPQINSQINEHNI